MITEEKKQAALKRLKLEQELTKKAKEQITQQAIKTAIDYQTRKNNALNSIIG